MAHLLIVELPGGNDVDILVAVLRRGDRFSFLTGDLQHYQTNQSVWQWVAQASHILEVAGFEASALEAQVGVLQTLDPLQGLLCLQDLRLVESARLAQRLGLRHLDPHVAEALRDKFKVRQRLAEEGMSSQPFALATHPDELRKAIDNLGLPLLIKPVDGYGSQNVIALKEAMDLDPWMTPLDQLLPTGHDYGLGVKANGRWLVERWLEGQFIGCDTFTKDGQHRLLGVNEKLMFEPPSFAIRGGCFCPNEGQFESLERYVNKLLDAVQFNHGAAHIEIMQTSQGFELVEINPRLVGAKIARLVSHAMGVSVHEALIDLHLGLEPQWAGERRFACTRWLAADRTSTLDEVQGPNAEDSRVMEYAILRRRGEQVQRPMENVDRLGYVMTADADRQAAEVAAQRWVDACEVRYL